VLQSIRKPRRWSFACRSEPVPCLCGSTLRVLPGMSFANPMKVEARTLVSSRSGVRPSAGTSRRLAMISPDRYGCLAYAHRLRGRTVTISPGVTRQSPRARNVIGSCVTIMRQRAVVCLRLRTIRSSGVVLSMRTISKRALRRASTLPTTALSREISPGHATRGILHLAGRRRAAAARFRCRSVGSNVARCRNPS
jgi:hypothetical protein